MSNVEEISEQLSAYLDGELSDEESRRIEEMLTDDSALSDEMESLREVRLLLRNLPHAQAPDGMADVVLARAQRGGAGWWAGYLARAAAVLLVVGVGVTVATWMGKPHRSVTEPQGAITVKTPILTRGKIVEVSGIRMAGATNVSINTDNIFLTQLEVESVFGSNSIMPVVEADGSAKASAVSRGAANFYSQAHVAPTQIRYEVVIEENQMRRVVSELNEIRARQNVSQMSMESSHRNGGHATGLAGSAGGRVRGDSGSMDKERSERKASGRSLAGGVVEDTPSAVPADAATKPAVHVKQLVVILNTTVAEE